MQTVKTTIILDEETYLRLRAISAKNRVSVSKIIRDIAQNFILSLKKGGKK